MPKSKPKNPFYLLLIPVGAVFCVTACAYCVMAFQAVNAARVEMNERAGHPLLAWLGEHGDMLMIGEIVVLGILTFAAIGLDSWLSERERTERELLTGEVLPTGGNGEN